MIYAEEDIRKRMGMSKRKYWIGQEPINCDMCGFEFKSYFVDGATRYAGAWAFLCPKCHKLHGIGLGTGKGQKYKKESKEKWVKIAG